jgi:starch synthase
MKIAIVAAEMTPHAKAGGLADVIGALPAALTQRGAEVAVVIPGYRSALEKASCQRLPGELSVALGSRRESFRVRRGSGPGGVALYLIEHEGFFNRAGLYGEGGRDYADNLQRYLFFGRAAAVALAKHVHPDVIHSHDWHAAVLPIVIRADPALRETFARTASLFTIHNLAFQGIFDRGDYPLLNLDWSYFSIDCLEFYGRMNLMKGAVTLADAASTVSPTYAREVTSDPELGFGLEGVLRARGDRFMGILNGADYNEWNPAGDDYLAVHYGPRDADAGKLSCKEDLRSAVDIPDRDGRPLVGMVTRMTPQKGFDLLAQGIEELMSLDMQLVILGSGDPAVEEIFKQAQSRSGGKLRVILGFDNALAHKIQAGSDMFLMPSRFEPCGLTQMYALKYGTAPVVRATGGLADTVSEFDPRSGKGNGFVFHQYRHEDLLATLARAIAVYRQPSAWRRLRENGFAADFSWTRAADRYLEVFARLYAERVG